MRKKIYDIIEPTKNVTTVEKIYDIFMVIVIIASLLPLTIKTHSTFYAVLENVTTLIFIIDYVLRLMTADFKLKQGKISFIKYPFTFLAITDLVAILSSLLFWNNTFRLFKIVRMIRTVRVFKLFRYSRSINMLIHVLKKQKESLLIVGALVVIYIFISALVIFNVEPTTFNNFSDNRWLRRYLRRLCHRKINHYDFINPWRCYHRTSCQHHDRRLPRRNRDTTPQT